jgi:1-acyl-sn-glycerol-3-phosphate acyltransferase
MLSLFVISNAIQVLSLSLWPFLSSTRRLKMMGQIFRGVMSFVIHLNLLWRMKVVNLFKEAEPHNVIFMCNHLSNADPFFGCAALWPWETKYISKASLFNVPFGGWAMSLAGDIPVYFTKEKEGWGTRPGSVRAMMEHCTRLLHDGETNIMVYPEGIRSKTGELLEFKDGMFSLAIKEEVDIVPMALRGTGEGWPKGSWMIDSCDATLVIGERIKVKGQKWELEDLKKKVREVILDLRDNKSNKAKSQ